MLRHSEASPCSPTVLPPGGPLHQGRLISENGEACVVCPWHGSTFRLADGAVKHGPATAPQPTFETRIRSDGIIQVRPAHRIQ